MSQRDVIERLLIKYCRSKPYSLSELSVLLDMNKNTLRAHYIYPLVRSGVLKKTLELPARSANKFYC